MRITKRDVAGMFSRFVRTGISVGVLQEGTEYVLDYGNSTYHYQYRIRELATGHTILTTGQGGLGTTPREAYSALQAACQAWDMVNEMERREPVKF